MKKIIICLLFLGAGALVQAQSIESIHKMMERGDFKGAKVAIDKAMQNEKNVNNPDYQYYKGRIYNDASYDTTLQLDERVNLKMEAFTAFQQNQKLDNKDLRMKLEQYKSYLDLYYSMNNLGGEYFRAKKYDESANTFIKALSIHNFLHGKGYKYDGITFSTLDTATVLNIGIAAALAKNEQLSIEYYKKIVDADISGKDFESAYESMVYYYDKTDDETKLNALLEKVKRYYPDNLFIRDTELRRLSKSGNVNKLLEGYEDLLKTDPNNFTTLYNYSIELYNMLYVSENKPADPEPYRQKLTSLLKRAITVDTTINATSLMANHLFYASIDMYVMHDEIEGKKPEDLAKRKELKDRALAFQKEAIPFAEKVLAYYDAKPTLRLSEKGARVEILSTLSDIYTSMGNTTKAEEYEKMKLKGL